MGTHALNLISPAKELIKTIKDSFNFSMQALKPAE